MLKCICITAVSIPGSAECNIYKHSSNWFRFGTASTAFGIEYHTASDFLADGLKASYQFQLIGAAATSTYRTDSHIATM